MSYALVRSTVRLQVLVIARHESTGRQTMTTIRLRLAGMMAILITCLAVLATVDEYGGRMAEWTAGQQVAARLWLTGWRDDLSLMSRAIREPWTGIFNG